MARRIRSFGPDVLHMRAGNSHPSKLSKQQRLQLAATLKQPPASLGHGSLHWTAAVLRRYIQETFAVRFSLRHCRRLLAPHRPSQAHRSVESHSTERRTDRIFEVGQRMPATLPVADFRRKLRAMASIKRLASSGIPLQPFVYTLFDVVNDAIPFDEVSPGMAIRSTEDTVGSFAISIIAAGSIICRDI